MARIPEILYPILEDKKAEVEALYKNGLSERYKDIDFCKKPPNFFEEIIGNKRQGIHLIAEYKPASPLYKEPIYGSADFEKVVRVYEDSGASAISVLTDRAFQGDLDLLARCALVTDKPILRKDFIIDEAQIYESRYFGADAVLLMSMLLSRLQLNYYLSLSHQLGMDCLVDVFSVEEIEQALEAGARIIGINNRNLFDLRVDLGRTYTMKQYIPQGVIVVSQSGIKSRSEVEKLQEWGVDAMLVGMALMETRDLQLIRQKIVDLLGC